jgi:hypothetical protein
MLRDDYLLRLIEQIGRLVARLRELLLKGEVVVEDEVRQTAAAAGYDLGLLRLLTTESLASLVNPTGRPDALKTVLVAELIFADALICRSHGDSAGEAERMEKVSTLLAAAETDEDPVRRGLVVDRIKSLRQETANECVR